MLIDEFDYDLPPDRIAQEPARDRDGSSMLILDPSKGPCRDFEVVSFSHFPEYLAPGDAVVFNDTKVIPARLFARKETGAKIEILLLSPEADGRWDAFLRNAKRLRPGDRLRLTEADALTDYTVLFEEKRPDGTCLLRFDPGQADLILKQCGHLPLPPYIRRPDAPLDSERYQTVYASSPGAVAAPTAGLHFTPGILQALEKKGVRSVKLTLHVGAGTFKPVEEKRIEDHVMHAEHYVFSPEAAGRLNETKRNGGRILAVGTTSLRTLESCVREDGFFEPGAGETSIYIHPPYRIRSADMLLTNFHLPKSTLLMLVSSFAGMEQTRAAYRFAVEKHLRFFSYGDCMLITNRI